MAEAIPPAHLLTSGVAVEQKLDGHQALLFTASGPGDIVLVQTRRGALVLDRWPAYFVAFELLQ
ncbi:hypothetical protein [Streptomyces sp. NPDC086989]|uniref:hypothetical protein n=1 Tax=Streptomyces sp. NPDC086989 TaxID=3365764 RepID=UPI00382C8B61